MDTPTVVDATTVEERLEALVRLVSAWLRLRGAPEPAGEDARDAAPRGVTDA